MVNCAREARKLPRPPACGRGLLLALLLPAAGAAPLFAADLGSSVGFNANWQHQASGGDDIDTRQSLQQRYNLGTGAGIGLNVQPTHAISAGGNLSYTRSDLETRRAQSGELTTSDTATITHEEWSPSAFFGLNNDIFRVNLTGTATEGRSSVSSEFSDSFGAGRSSSLQAETSSHTWNSTLASTWEEPWWPNLQLTYGQGRQADTAATGELSSDSQDSRYGLGLDWDLKLAQLFYDFNHTRQEDLVDSSQSSNESHFLRLETGGRFWSNRASFNLSQQFQQTASEFSARLEEGDLFDWNLEGQPLSAVINLPTFDEIRDIELGAFMPLEVASNQRIHLGLRLDFSQQVDLLYLKLDPNAGAPPTLQWDLYLRDPVDDTWALAQANIEVSYNEPEQRLELVINRLVREFMVVADNSSGFPLELSALEALSLLGDNFSSRRQTHLTNAGLRLRLSNTLTASSNLTLEESESESGETMTDSMRLAYSGSLRWAPVSRMSAALGYSETFQEESFTSTAINRTYSLTTTTLPLPALNITLGAARTDRYTGTRKIATTDSYSLTSTARLYPDLTAGLYSNYTIGSRQPVEGGDVASSSFSNRVTLNARLRPSLTADLTVNHRQSRTETTNSSASGVAVGLAYRPSDLISMRFGSTHRLSGPESQDTMVYSLNLSLLRTEKTRLTFRYNRSQGEQTSDALGLDGSWDINQSLALQTRANYRLGETDVWNVMTTLALKL